MLTYKIDILETLKAKGYTTYRIRKEKLIPEGSMQRLRKKAPIGWETLETLCRLLECQPSDILHYVSDDDNILSSGK